MRDKAKPLPKISIVVCTYNAKDDLKECLDSLEKQDFKDFNIVIVDDSSTDGTFEFLQDFKARTVLHVSVVTNSTNLGVAGARNIGIQHATGEITAFIDADSTADPRWISELVNIYDKKDVAAVGGRILDARLESIWDLTFKGHDFIAASEGCVPFIKGGNMSFKSNLLKSLKFNDEIKYGYEDLLLCDYLNDNGYKVYYTPRAVVYHKNRATLKGLLKQKFSRGLSSVWYLKKRNRFFMYKRHFILLSSLIFLPLMIINDMFMYLSLVLFSVFTLSLLREEIIFNAKSYKEIILTLPLVILIEFIHFSGSVTGVVKFRLFQNTA